MSVLALQWGAGLIVFSPLSMLFILIVLRKPELVIIAILRSVFHLAPPSLTMQPSLRHVLQCLVFM